MEGAICVFNFLKSWGELIFRKQNTLHTEERTREKSGQARMLWISRKEDRDGGEGCDENIGREIIFTCLGNEEEESFKLRVHLAGFLSLSLCTQEKD